VFIPSNIGGIPHKAYSSPQMGLLLRRGRKGEEGEGRGLLISGGVKERGYFYKGGKRGERGRKGREKEFPQSQDEYRINSE